MTNPCLIDLDRFRGAGPALDKPALWLVVVLLGLTLVAGTLMHIRSYGRPM